MAFTSPLDMYKQANLYLDKFDAPNFVKSEFAIFYNNVVQAFVINRCKIVEGNQEIIDDLRVLSTKVLLTVFDSEGYDLPVDYQYWLAAQWKIEYKDCRNRVRVRLQSSKASKLDSLYVICQSPTKKPAYDCVYHELRGTKIIPYCDVENGQPAFNTSKVLAKECHLNYIRKPSVIGFDNNTQQFTGTLEFPQATLEKIFIQLCTTMLENIEQGRLPSFFKINQSLET